MIAFSRRRRRRAGTDLTPLIDVVFQLLVFFMLTSVFIDPAVPLKLPGADTAEAQKDAPLMISITADGQLHLGDQIVADGQLPEAIEAALKGKKEKKVAIRGDGAARYERFMKVVDACRQVGVIDVALAAEAPPPEAP